MNSHPSGPRKLFDSNEEEIERIVEQFEISWPEQQRANLKLNHANSIEQGDQKQLLMELLETDLELRHRPLPLRLPDFRISCFSIGHRKRPSIGTLPFRRWTFDVLIAIGTGR